MSKIFLYAFVGVAVIHGLIHLMGLVAYWPLGEIAELPYKTVLVNGRFNLGATGMRLFSSIWLIAAVGFIVGAIGLVTNQSWAMPVLLSTSALSIVITALDWEVAFRGTIISAVVIVLLLIAPRLSAWLGMV
ncbi:MAG: ABC transporter permease [Chloroflexi bacterium]|nr:MAG: ABC transporter permease [Chloroflexota bacterium]